MEENKIGIFVVSTYNTDYVLVKETDFENAMTVLAPYGKRDRGVSGWSRFVIAGGVGMFKEWKKLAGKPLRIIDILISIVVIGLTVFLIVYWKHIPEQVPLHWNFEGEIDDYADAGSYIMLVIMMYFFYVWHQLTKLSPTLGWKENIFGKEPAGKVSDEVANEAFNTMMLMLWVCDLIIQIMLAYIIVCGVCVANLGKWFLPITFILLTMDFVWFGIKLVRIKNRNYKLGKI